MYKSGRDSQKNESIHDLANFEMNRFTIHDSSKMNRFIFQLKFQFSCFESIHLRFTITIHFIAENRKFLQEVGKMLAKKFRKFFCGISLFFESLIQCSIH